MTDLFTGRMLTESIFNQRRLNLLLHHFIDIYVDGVEIDLFIDESAEMSI